MITLKFVVDAFINTLKLSEKDKGIFTKKHATVLVESGFDDTITKIATIANFADKNPLFLESVESALKKLHIEDKFKGQFITACKEWKEQKGIILSLLSLISTRNFSILLWFASSWRKIWFFE